VLTDVGTGEAVAGWTEAVGDGGADWVAVAVGAFVGTAAPPHWVQVSAMTRR
jgi:hypothetical protein